jgi:hypothetical protein
VPGPRHAGSMSKTDIAILWSLSGLAALAAICGKLGMLLFAVAQDPPADPVEFRHWERRRRWLIYSEFSALPLFATAGVSATIYFSLPPIASVLISMGLGALGFGFLLNGVQLIARRRLGIDQ